jgi:thiamine pyrophosphokinase
MHALIIVNGPLPSHTFYEKELTEAGLIICANGGAKRAFAAKVNPHFVTGDLDSLSGDVREKLKDTTFVHRPSQYATDLEKALQFALEKGAKSATAIGFSGGRFDHQLTNLNILQKFSDRLEITCLDDSGAGRFVRDKIKLQVEIGQQISLMAFQKASGITTKGLKYPLKNGALEWGKKNGQSNETVSQNVEISVKSGVLFVFCVWSDFA